MNRRERHALVRRQQILDVALRLFTSKGYLETSMEEIAEAADIARGTLYNHFESKADLVLALTSAVRDEWMAVGTGSIEAGKPVTAILDLLASTAAWFDEHPQSARIFYYAMRELVARQNHEAPPPILIPQEWVEAAQDKGELTRELPADVIILVLDAVLRSSLIKSVQGISDGKMAPVVKERTEVLLTRLRP